MWARYQLPNTFISNPRISAVRAEDFFRVLAVGGRAERLFPSREEDRPNLRARSATALDIANQQSIELADYVAGAVACMPHEAVQAPCTGARLQYITDSS